MNDSFIAWLAGLIDGDGSICFQHQIAGFKANRKTKSFSVTPIIAISLLFSDLPWLQYIKDTSGIGKIYEAQIRGGDGARPQYRWQTTTKQEVKTLLALLVPFLRLKQKQAQITLGILDTLSKYATPGGRTFMTKVPRKEMKEISFLLSTMNSHRSPTRYRHIRTPEEWAKLVDEAYDSHGLP